MVGFVAMFQSWFVMLLEFLYCGHLWGMKFCPLYGRFQPCLNILCCVYGKFILWKMWCFTLQCFGRPYKPIIRSTSHHSSLSGRTGQNHHRPFQKHWDGRGSHVPDHHDRVWQHDGGGSSGHIQPGTGIDHWSGQLSGGVCHHRSGHVEARDGERLEDLKSRHGF